MANLKIKTLQKRNILNGLNIFFLDFSRVDLLEYVYVVEKIS